MARGWGGRWHWIEAGEIPCVILVREGAVIPHVPVAQSTNEIAWDQAEDVGFNGLPTDAKK